MDLINLKSYRVRKETSYYNSGYYIADIISMHRCLASLSGTSGKLELKRMGYIGYVAPYKGKETKRYDTILYDPIELYRTDSDELMYIAAHEVSHIKNNDGFRTKTLKSLLDCFGICMFFITSYFCLPLVVMVPVLIRLMFLAGNRETETQADLGALEYVSLSTVLKYIGDNGNETKYAWLLYDHATRKKLLRKLKKKYKNEKRRIRWI